MLSNEIFANITFNMIEEIKQIRLEEIVLLILLFIKQKYKCQKRLNLIIKKNCYL